MPYVELQCYMQIKSPEYQHLFFFLPGINADVCYVLISVIFVNVFVYCSVSVYRCLPGKWKRLSRWPFGEGFGGGVALGGLLCWKGAGDEGVEEVVEDGLLLESS